MRNNFHCTLKLSVCYPGLYAKMKCDILLNILPSFSKEVFTFVSNDPFVAFYFWKYTYVYLNFLTFTSVYLPPFLHLRQICCKVSISVSLFCRVCLIWYPNKRITALFNSQDCKQKRVLFLKINFPSFEPFGHVHFPCVASSWLSLRVLPLPSLPPLCSQAWFRLGQNAVMHDSINLPDSTSHLLPGFDFFSRRAAGEDESQEKTCLSMKWREIGGGEMGEKMQNISYWWREANREAVSSVYHVKGRGQPWKSRECHFHNSLSLSNMAELCQQWHFSHSFIVFDSRIRWCTTVLYLMKCCIQIKIHISQTFVKAENTSEKQGYLKIIFRRAKQSLFLSVKFA